jgi:hypothetical protein
MKQLIKQRDMHVSPSMHDPATLPLHMCTHNIASQQHRQCSCSKAIGITCMTAHMTKLGLHIRGCSYQGSACMLELCQVCRSTHHIRSITHELYPALAAQSLQCKHLLPSTSCCQQRLCNITHG